MGGSRDGGRINGERAKNGNATKGKSDKMKSNEKIEGRERVGASTRALRDRHALAPPHPRKMHTYARARRTCSQTVQPQSENADDDSQKEANLHEESDLQSKDESIIPPRSASAHTRERPHAATRLHGAGRPLELEDETEQKQSRERAAAMRKNLRQGTRTTQPHGRGMPAVPDQRAHGQDELFRSGRREVGAQDEDRWST